MTDEERWSQDYGAVREYFFHLADIRFKLLGFLPLVTGAAILVLPEHASSAERLGVGILGFVVTIGLTIYDQRNTQMYDRLVKRAQMLEACFCFEPFVPKKRRCGGAFIDRPARRQFLGFDIIWHDLGLALVYSASLAAWAFISIRGLGAGSVRIWLQVTVPGAVFLTSFFLLRHLAKMNDAETLPQAAQRRLDLTDGGGTPKM